MIHTVIIDREGEVLELRDEEARRTIRAVELTVDQHFGVRLEANGEWTTISFREGGAWSTPVDTREVVRERF
jgi:hypothetical protein